MLETLTKRVRRGATLGVETHQATPAGDLAEIRSRIAKLEAELAGITPRIQQSLIELGHKADFHGASSPPALAARAQVDALKSQHLEMASELGELQLKERGLVAATNKAENANRRAARDAAIPQISKLAKAMRGHYEALYDLNVEYIQLRNSVGISGHEPLLDVSQSELKRHIEDVDRYLMAGK